MMNFTEKLTNEFWEVFDDETIVVRDEITADDVDEWDSLLHVNLMMIAIKLAFDIEFQQNEFQNVAFVRKLIHSIKDKY